MGAEDAQRPDTAITAVPASLLRDRRALALLLAATLTVMANATISPALPQIEALFADAPGVALKTRLLVTAPALLVAILAPFVGIAADRFGRRNLLLLGTVIYAIAGTAGLYLTSLDAVLASRLALGVGVALVMTSQAALVGDYFAGALRGRFMGYQMAAVNFSGCFFLALAGAVAEMSARLPFAVYGIALLYLPLLLRVIVDPARPAATAHAAAPDPGRGGWLVTLGGLCLIAGFTMMLFYLMPTQFPFYLRASGHDSPALSGLLLGALTIAGGAAGLSFGRLRERFGKGGGPAIGYVVMAAGYAVLAASQQIWPLALGAALVGGGFGLVMPGFITLALDIAPEGRRGLASGAITTSIFLAQFLSPLASQPLIDAIGYGRSFAVTAGLLIGLSAVVWLSFQGGRSRAATGAESAAPGDRRADHAARVGT